MYSICIEPDSSRNVILTDNQLPFSHLVTRNDTPKSIDMSKTTNPKSKRRMCIPNKADINNHDTRR